MARLTPMKAIRAKCLECSNGQVKEVRLCPIKRCALYECRLGHRPKDEEVITEESLDEKTQARTVVFSIEGNIGKS